MAANPTNPAGSHAPPQNTLAGQKISFALRTKPAAAGQGGSPKPNLAGAGPARAPASQRTAGADERDERERTSVRRGRSPGYPADQTDSSNNGTGFGRPVVRAPRPKRRRLVRRLKEGPVPAAEMRQSDSVYYRKPGNESVIGAGTYGKVFKAIHVYTNDLVALKKIKMEGERDGFPVTAIREIKLLQSLAHDNIVELREVMVERNDCFMVFEYLSHDLTGLLNHPSFTLEDGHKKDLAKQLFEGLDYLHRRGILHRDIKAANILVSNTGQLKLADFGLARVYHKHAGGRSSTSGSSASPSGRSPSSSQQHQQQQQQQRHDYTNRVITIWYRPPELLLGETRYGPAVDIWSAACVLVEIFTRKPIFPGDGSELSQLDKIYSVLGTPSVSGWPGLADMMWAELLQPAEHRGRTFADAYRARLSPAAFELLECMLAYDPDSRPTAADVLAHDYFAAELPPPARPVQLRHVAGDWHEFESKALRKEKERRERDGRRRGAAAAAAAAGAGAGLALPGSAQPDESKGCPTPRPDGGAGRGRAAGGEEG